MRLGKQAPTETISTGFGLSARAAKTPYAHDPASPGQVTPVPGLFLIVAAWVNHVTTTLFPRIADLRHSNPVVHFLAGLKPVTASA